MQSDMDVDESEPLHHAQLLKLMMRREMEEMVTSELGDLVRRVEEIEKAVFGKRVNTEEEFSEFRTADDEVTERCLRLKLSEKVSDEVLTGKPLLEKGGSPLKVELVDRETERIVETGPMSSAKVEVLVLDASGDDDECSQPPENFDEKIIKEGDKERPHFTKNVCVKLNGGVGILSNVKLGHASKWMKRCRCRLGARIVGGGYVEQGRTNAFTVLDSRSRQYKKHDTPRLSDEVWRLRNIGRVGGPCKRLRQAKIKTVEDFLFMLSADPQRLENLVCAGAKWKDTVDHALKCPKDDDRVYLHYPSSESKVGVIFNVMGGLKGVINDSHFVPVKILSAEQRDTARKLLVSAFENREARVSFDDEASIVEKFAHRSGVSDMCEHDSVQHDMCEHDQVSLIGVSYIVHSDPRNSPYPFGNPDHESHCYNPSSSYDICFSEISARDVPLEDDVSVSSAINSNIGVHPETQRVEPTKNSRARRYISRAANVKLWVVRVKKKARGKRISVTSSMQCRCDDDRRV